METLKQIADLPHASRAAWMEDYFESIWSPPPNMDLSPHLLRWLLIDQNDQVNIFVHKFLGPDELWFHNHPWDFTTHILSGGYTERVLDPDFVPVRYGGNRKWFSITHRFDTRRFEVQHHQAGEVLQRQANHFHCITDVEPSTWSLVITGKTTGESWGFVKNDKFVSHEKALTEPGSDGKRPVRDGAAGSGLITPRHIPDDIQ